MLTSRLSLNLNPSKKSCPMGEVVTKAEVEAIPLEQYRKFIKNPDFVVTVNRLLRRNRLMTELEAAQKDAKISAGALCSLGSTRNSGEQKPMQMGWLVLSRVENLVRWTPWSGGKKPMN